VSAPILHLSIWQKPVFLVNSRLGRFSAAWSLRLPFSLGYGVILPSSLTKGLPRVFEFSSCLPVSVLVRVSGLYSAFSWQCEFDSFSTYFSILIINRLFWIRVFPLIRTLYLNGLFRLSALLSSCVNASRSLLSTRFSTSCPSPTHSCLGLGPDFPWEDEPSPGNLRLSTEMILTSLFATHASILSSVESTSPSGSASSPTHCSSTIVSNPQLRYLI
jgi:hypothetical protein